MYVPSSGSSSSSFPSSLIAFLAAIFSSYSAVSSAFLFALSSSCGYANKFMSYSLSYPNDQKKQKLILYLLIINKACSSSAHTCSKGMLMFSHERLLSLCTKRADIFALHVNDSSVVSEWLSSLQKCKDSSVHCLSAFLLLEISFDCSFVPLAKM